MNFIKILVSSRITNNLYNITKNNFHHMIVKNSYTSLINMTPYNFLIPKVLSINPNCGLKYRVVLKRRCKDCYFVRREDRLYVMCKTHPRHKQAKLKPKEKDTRILAHATQGTRRPW